MDLLILHTQRNFNLSLKCIFKDQRILKATAIIFLAFVRDLSGIGHVLRAKPFVQLLFGEQLLLQDQGIDSPACLEGLFGDRCGLLITL
jgi:hypothetical protein